MTVCSFGRYVKLVALALLIEKKPYVTAVSDNRTGQVLQGEKIPKLVLKIRNHVPRMRFPNNTFQSFGGPYENS